MTDRKHVEKWLQNYIDAWKNYDADAIGVLFSEGAVYRYNPFDEPVKGRQAIVANWLEYRDPPGSWKAEYKPIAVDGDTAVVNGLTVYYEADGETLRKQYDNIFVLRFDDEGRCADFCEWFMEPRA
jgi:ketosteroid isomerase-like protein